ncbi:hypothetical protein HKD37_17G047806 [Glycine soja]
MEISSFHQFPDESLSEALDRFHGLLQKTPTHGFSELVQINIFIDGLRPHSKQLLDVSAGGKIKLKTSDEAMELIENMAASDHSLLELTSQDTLLAQNKLLAKQIETLTETLSKLPQQLHGSIKEDLQDTIKGKISLNIKAKVGDPILEITSTKIKVSLSNHKSIESAIRNLELSNLLKHPRTVLWPTRRRIPRRSVRSQRRENAEREKKVDGVLEYVSYDEGENKKREKDEEEKNESKERGDEVFPIKPKVKFSRPFHCLPGAKAGQGPSHSTRSTISTSGDPSFSYNRKVFSLFLSAEVAPLYAAEPPQQPVPFDAELSPTISPAASDDTRGILISGCLARSPTSFCKGGGVIPLILVMMMPQRLKLIMITLRTSLLHMKLEI